jgi:uncharacterized membrane protein
MTDEHRNQGRIGLIDALRGCAIIAMIGYHALWDATLFGFVGAEIILSRPAMAAQALILGSFVLLAGASLVLATRNGIDWPRLLRRFLVLAGAALAITIVTVWLFPETYVFFGVLHALALFTLIGLPFLRLPTPAAAVAAVVTIALPMLFSDPVFTNRWLAWIGFYPTSPPTNDLVPVFPWFGVFLIGIAGMRWLIESGLSQRLPHAGGVLASAGRWSLLIYLAHQPLLFGGFYAANALASQARPASREAAFVQSCEASCGATAGLAYCQRYCGCALNGIIENDLWEAVGSATPTAEEQQAISSVTNACAALSAE